ncbi:DNA primase large subunit Spp2 [Coemansia javaensis]|uniref:DNA primase large subunit Spp2 n=1 Tax=Coemansia javaensis TaxID=2761396 RepID=A0A9W8HKX2_9FUNG|nr:DNA primase large subunit Spp2 [Coemansia javaensis]
MRKSGARPPAKAGGGNGGGFAGFKIKAAPSTTVAPSRAFGDGHGGSSSGSRDMLGVAMEVTAAQDGDRIRAQGEEGAAAAGEALVIPARRNADWMARKSNNNNSNSNKRPDSLRDAAIHELASGQSTTTTTARRAAVPLQEQREDQAYAEDIGEYSDVSDGAYDRVPVEEFGAAMLRGMGWSEGGDGRPEPANADRPRPSLLGLGAKPLPKELAPDKPRAKRF